MDSVARAGEETRSSANEGSAAGTSQRAEHPVTARVSVIATVLNEAESIEALLDSLLRQTFAPIEIVVVDGGSEDGTWARLERAAAQESRLRVVQDVRCHRRYTQGPIARGRNVAIALAGGDVIACADAGCTYGEGWLEHLTAPLWAGERFYALGGSYIDPAKGATVWDLAAAPFFGVKLRADAPQRSCTARSMAFRRELWQRVGGFPETAAIGEDTLFDAEARRITAPVFVPSAKALYRPNFTFRTATEQLWRYSVTDGALRLRPGRFSRNALRCGLELLALGVLPWTWWPCALALIVEVYCAYQFDGREVFALWRPKAWLARLSFSALVPWVVAGGMLYGRRRKIVPTSLH